MYKVTKRDCPMFGIGPYVCEFICDTVSDISTLPTSISEGTGGRTAYDNQKCASGSIANVAENGAESKQYMLNNQDIWCPYSIAAGSSDSVLEEAKAYTDSEIADLINGAPTTRDTLKEIADAMAENQTVVETLDAAIGSKANKTDIPTKVSQLENDSGFLTEHQDLSAYAKTADLNTAVSSINTTLGTKANKTDIPTSLPANGGNADTVDGLHAEGFIKTNSSDAYDCNTLYDAGLYLCNGSATNTPNDLIYGSLFVMPYRKPYGNEGPDYCAQIFIPNGDASDASMWYRTSLQNTWNEWKRTCDNDNYALKAKYGDTTIDVGRKAGTTVGSYSTAEGYNTTASGIVSHAEGQSTTASEDCAHAEGWKTTASGKWSHAEGQDTTASGIYSHAEGFGTAASGNCSHAEGYETTASGIGSHASGIGTQALHRNEAAYGTFNESNDDTLFSIGDGTADDARHNAFEITASGGKLHDKDIATTDLMPIIKSINFSADTTDGYIWTGIPFPKYVIGVDLGHFDVIVQFYKGNHADAGRAEWAMKFFSMNDMSTPLNGSFNGTIYYIG